MSAEKYNAQATSPGWKSASVLGGISAASPAERCDEPVRQTAPIEHSVTRINDAVRVLFDEIARLEHRIETVLSPEACTNQKDSRPPVPNSSPLNQMLDLVGDGIENAIERLRTMRIRVEL